MSAETTFYAWDPDARPMFRNIANGPPRLEQPTDIRKAYGYSDIAHRLIEWGTGVATSPMCLIRLPLNTGETSSSIEANQAAALRMERAG